MKNDETFTFENIGNFLETLAEQSESVYWLSSPDLKKIQYISPAFEKIWGRKREILYNNPEIWITFLHPDDAKQRPIDEMAEKIKQMGPEARYSANYRIVRPNGETRWIIDRGFPIYDKMGECCGITGVAIDITKEKLAEEALRKAKEDAEAANKAKTEFLENMRHDIRTPITGIIGFASIIREESENTKIKEYADHLVVSSNALLEFLNDILEAVQVSSGGVPLLKQKFNLKNKLSKVIGLNQARAQEKRLELKLEVDESIPNYLVGDHARIFRIILELVTNALNFTNNGHVIVKAKLAKKQDKDLVLKISVEDTGVGIPPDKKHEIFTRFKRLTPSYEGIYKGVGLGLYIVKQFIDDLDAEIYVESESPNKGSIFICVIPLKEALLDEAYGVDELAEKIPNLGIRPILTAVPPLPLRATKSRVLLIEDHLLTARITKDILTSLNCQVDFAINGETAILQAENNHYDLIFMDIGLPDMSGYEVTKQIRLNEKDKRSPVPIIALTAHVDTKDKKRCIEMGMNAVLVKPLLKDKASDILNAFIAHNPKEIESTSLPDKKDLLMLQGKVIDLEFGAQLIDGNLEAAKNMVNALIETLPRESKKLQGAYLMDDWELIKISIHRLRGAVAYCGLPRLQEACVRLEDYLNRGFKEYYEPLYEQLLKEIELILKESPLS